MGTLRISIERKTLTMTSHVELSRTFEYNDKVPNVAALADAMFPKLLEYLDEIREEEELKMSKANDLDKKKMGMKWRNVDKDIT